MRAGVGTRLTFPHVSFTQAEVREYVTQTGLSIEHEETFKFHIDNLDVAVVKRILNLIDRVVPPHGRGDIVAVVARKPPFEDELANSR